MLSSSARAYPHVTPRGRDLRLLLHVDAGVPARIRVHEAGSGTARDGLPSRLCCREPPGGGRPQDGAARGGWVGPLVLGPEDFWHLGSSVLPGQPWPKGKRGVTRPRGWAQAWPRPKVVSGLRSA